MPQTDGMPGRDPARGKTHIRRPFVAGSTRIRDHFRSASLLCLLSLLTSCTPPAISQFQIPRQIIVAIAPYSSVQEALSHRDDIDWTHDRIRARAITLAYAATELHNQLAAAGVTTTLTPASASHADGAYIDLAVRDGTTASASMPDAAVNYQALGNQGYAITPVDGRLYITAASRIGVLYGVYRLLDYLGFAWDDPYETQLPRTHLAGHRITWPTLREKPRVMLRGFWIFGQKAIPDEFAIWMARNRLNIGGVAKPSLQHMLGLKGWGGGHYLLQEEFSRPGLFEQHPDWFAEINGKRRPVAPTGDYFNPSFASTGAANYFADRMIQRLQSGDLKNVDILNIWPTDDRFNRFDQSQAALALGNETDNLLHFYSIVNARFKEAYQNHTLSRKVIVAGISYFLTMEPPTNYEVTSELEGTDYLHIFYPIDEDWSDVVNRNLDLRDSNRKLMQNLNAWQTAARLNYGVVEYYNFSNYAGLCLTDFRFLAGDYAVLTQDRTALFAYMHPLLKNPGPRRLTNVLLAKLAWQPLNDVATAGKRITQQYFARRYGRYATQWRQIYDLMAESVSNAKEMYGVNSLYWVLFQNLIWSSPPYSSTEAASFIVRYRIGGTQELPGAYSRVTGDRESFLGLDDSIHLQQLAQTKWSAILRQPIPQNIRARMDSDVEWFAATASRYRLMAATADYVIATTYHEDVSQPRARMKREIDFLEKSPVLNDTISPVDQRAFLKLHKELAGIQ